ncbi:ferritin-like domain-containing protein [Mucilaginibacter galii]|nr:PA2169 family four-helix-bundle protein [Mucilaginibacter galii]
MDTTLKSAAEGLNHLIIIANDGKEGYAQAADIVARPMLKAMFSRLATERAEFATQLTVLVLATGTQPESGTGPLGALHRVWVEIKSSLVADDDDAALKECIRGDETAVAAYETVLKEHALTAEQQNIINQQLRLTSDALFSLRQELHGNNV